MKGNQITRCTGQVEDGECSPLSGARVLDQDLSPHEVSGPWSRNRFFGVMSVGEDRESQRQGGKVPISCGLPGAWTVARRKGVRCGKGHRRDGEAVEAVQADR